MKSSLKNKSIALSIVLATLCTIATSAASGATIYSNTNDSGYVLSLSSGEEVIDYGRTINGGIVTSFKFGFATDTHNPGSVKVRFYNGTNYYSRGSLIATLQVSLPYVSNTDYWYEHEYSIPTGQQFNLPSGQFGYSLEFSGNYNYAVYANGGLGNEAYFWMYVEDPWDWSWSWERFSASNSSNSGLYMQVYADPVATCSFSGYVYEDLAEDGAKTSGDPALQGWRIFVDQNSNSKYDIGEPNDITDSNGYYSIPNAPINSFGGLYQQTPGGWKPVNPESGSYHPWVSADSNYILHFGNKQHGEGTITGYKFNDTNANGIWNNGEPVMQGWRIYIDENNNGQFEATEPNDITDPNGFYEIPGLEAPADHTVAEVMKNDWYQSLPGGEGTYTISTEPNTITPYINFGNTTQPVITEVTISGQVLLSDGRGLSMVQINPFGAVTDENGYYSKTVESGWSGIVSAVRPGWIIKAPLNCYDITTDQTHNFTAHWPYSGGDGSQASPYWISRLRDLDAIAQHPEDSNKHFILINDINLATKTYTEPVINILFTGQFDGNGFSILNMTGNSGLFGVIKEGTVKNLGVENVEISCIRDAGALCNYNHGGTIENCFATGNITGNIDLGGLCGWVYKNKPEAFPGTGQADTPVIRNCYSAVNIKLKHPKHLYYADPTSSSTGGICAYAEGAVISNNYVTGTVDAEGADNYDVDVITRSGGLIGVVKNCNISNNYSIGKVVNRPFNVEGGLCAGLAVGDTSTFTANFWDFLASDQPDSVFGQLRSTKSLLSESTYIGWDFENTWRICDGLNYPKLAWEKFVPGDIVCPDGVGIEDLAALASQWMQTGTLLADIAPQGGDGQVNAQDLIVIAENWLIGR